MAACARTLPLVDKGVTPKKDGCRFCSIQYDDFPYFIFLFCLEKDANHLLPSDLPEIWLPVHAANTNKLPDPMPTQALHWDMQHPGCQGIRNDTGQPESGTRQIVAYVTDKDNTDGGVLQKPAELRRDVRCGVPILRW